MGKHRAWPVAFLACRVINPNLPSVEIDGAVQMLQGDARQSTLMLLSHSLTTEAQ